MKMIVCYPIKCPYIIYVNEAVCLLAIIITISADCVHALADGAALGGYIVM